MVTTRPPRRVDTRVAGWAMVLAPVVGALLAVAAGTFLWVLGWGPGGATGPLEAVGRDVRAHPFLAAALVIGLLAVLTRAMHLDGLADTADGLGSGRPPAAALEVMRRGDVGPFGVVTLVLVLLLQVFALGVLVAEGLGLAALCLSLVVSRFALPLLCSRGIPAARAEGLGSAVAGSVGRGQLALATALTFGVLLALLPLAADRWDAASVAVAVVASALGLLVAALLAGRALRRVGGVTGDVLGAAVEAAFTTVIVVLAVLA